MRSRSHVLILRNPVPLLPVVPIEVQAQSRVRMDTSAGFLSSYGCMKPWFSAPLFFVCLTIYSFSIYGACVEQGYEVMGGFSAEIQG